MRRYLLCLCLLTLLGCGPSDPDPDPGTSACSFHPDIEGPPPDILIVSLSGHSAGVAAALCFTVNDDDNRSYLGDPGDAIGVIRQAFVDAGNADIEERHFADRLRAPDANGDCVPDRLDQLGLEELLATLDEAFATWIDGQASPTRIVMVTHSHGTNWSGIAQLLRPNIPIEYLIQLDGVCQNWECEHEDQVSAWVQANGIAATVDISEPCDDGILINLGAGPMHNLKDVAFDQVRFNLEVQSTGPPPLRDTEDNVRLDGTTTGILRRGPGDILDADENHSGVHQAGSPAMNWVAANIGCLEATGVGCP